MTRTIEIDIENAQSPQKLEEELELKNLQKGDRLRLLTPQTIENELIAFSIFLIIYFVIQKRFQRYSEDLLNEVFKNQTIADIENELRKDYNIVLVIEEISS